MPTKFSLAKTLEYLLDDELRPPGFKALLTIPLIGLFVWLVANDRPPTPEEDALRARQFYSKAVVQKKLLNSRGEPVLDIAQGTLLAEEIAWGNSFFSSELPNGSFPTHSREAYLRAEQCSLVAYASAGDSLIKKRGDLSAVVKRGRQTRVFHFHSLWP